MVDIPMGNPREAIITVEDDPAIAIGLAIEDIQLVVVLEGVGPAGSQGPQGTSQMTYVQPGEPVGDLRAGDVWIKEPPELIPQPTFMWDGAAWNPIYGELSGSGSGGFYEHQQAVAAAEWNIAHLLHFEPPVTIENSVGNAVRGDLIYVDDDHLTIRFSEPVAGVAYLGSKGGASGSGASTGSGFRYVGPDEPDTTDWNVDDFWYDTSTE